MGELSFVLNRGSSTTLDTGGELKNDAQNEREFVTLQGWK